MSKCYLCGSRRDIEVHHCLHGPRRKAADKYGLVVPLCRHCHTLLHDHGIADQELEEVAQRVFERDHTREEFMREFGKSYL